MGTLKGKTLFITGASRGIGHAIGMRAARDGANIVIAAKTATPHPKLPGTIFSAAEDMEKAGGRALPVQTDIRDENQIAQAVAQAVAVFGGIDILVNNASAISLTGVLETPMKRFDLMNQINARGTYACAQACIPHLGKASNPHILTLASPISLDPKWYKGHLAYSLAKFGMSMCVIGLAAEFAAEGIASNGLWPHYPIATAAMAMVGGRIKPDECRTPEIMADAAHAILCRDSRVCTGNFFLDDRVLTEEGVTDFSRYGGDPEKLREPDILPREASL